MFPDVTNPTQMYIALFILVGIIYSLNTKLGILE